MATISSVTILTVRLITFLRKPRSYYKSEFKVQRYTRICTNGSVQSSRTSSRIIVEYCHIA